MFEEVSGSETTISDSGLGTVFEDKLDKIAVPDIGCDGGGGGGIFRTLALYRLPLVRATTTKNFQITVFGRQLVNHMNLEEKRDLDLHFCPGGCRG